MDLATSSERTADNAVICVVKLIEMESGAYLKKLVYMRSYYGKRLDALAEEVRRTYARFPRVVRIVFDHREPAPVSQGVFDRVRGVVTHALDSLGIRNSASHSEVKNRSRRRHPPD